MAENDSIRPAAGQMRPAARPVTPARRRQAAVALVVEAEDGAPHGGERREEQPEPGHQQHGRQRGTEASVMDVLARSIFHLARS